MHALIELQRATNAARAASGLNIATRAERGRVQVVIATPTRGGRFTIDPLSDFVALSVALETLRKIAADKGFRGGV